MEKVRVKYIKKAKTLLTPLLSLTRRPKGPVDKSTVTAAKKLDLKGCSNLYKVNDNLYRGAQPEEKGFDELAKLGIKTVVNLRQHHSDRNLIEPTKLDYVHILMKEWYPQFDEIKEFLQIVTDKKNQPVFVHCQYGAKRTGTMIAVYRIVVDGWTKQMAVREFTKGPFGFHTEWSLTRLIRNMDTKKLKQNLDITQ